MPQSVLTSEHKLHPYCRPKWSKCRPYFWQRTQSPYSLVLNISLKSIRRSTQPTQGNHRKPTSYILFERIYGTEYFLLETLHNLNENFGGSTDWAAKCYVSTDLHIPIHFQKFYLLIIRFEVNSIFKCRVNSFEHLIRFFCYCYFTEYKVFFLS